ncbi:MAG: 50S ribosomal protein L24e [Nanobdellota archaeon]
MKCSFCSKEISPGKGKMFVKKDGKVLYFDSRKCEKNMLELKRKARTTKWTEEHKRIKEEAK